MYANLTIQLYQEFDSTFFRVWGAIYAAGTILLWTWVFVRTLTMVHNGAIFESPDLDDPDIADTVLKLRLDESMNATRTNSVQDV